MRLGGNMQLDKLARSMDPKEPAIQINDHIFMGKGVSNSYLVTTPEGDVLINAGEPFEDHTARYSKVSRGPVRKIVFTQSHHDHIGSWARFSGPDVETIVQANFAFVRGERNRLARHFLPRRQRIFGERPDWGGEVRLRTNEVIAEPVPTTTFRDLHAFEIGGRRFELFSAPGGETLDSLFVWLPEERTVFTGNFLGPIFGTIPNLYTIRGDRLRSAVRYLEGVEQLLALEPRMLITGHGDPVAGAERVHEELAKLRDAVRFIYDETVKGMNEGIDVFTLMRTVTLPPHLRLGQGHGKVSWCVRAIWEEATGWFRFESTTELYDVPARAIWGELAEMAGGPDVLAGRAAGHVAADRPLEALHLIDIALSVDPAHRTTLQTKLEALQILLDRSGRENYSEVHWLESEMDAARAALGEGG
jgi:alkyl sulfatase BDS1-like metallo-beta-lactamase superfamily hydrolase